MRHLILLAVALALAPSKDTCGQWNWYHLDTSNTGLEANTPSFLAFDQEGGLWTANEMGGPEGLGLFHFDGSTWTKYDQTDVPQLVNGVRNAVCDPEGNMWFTVYDKGLLKYDGVAWTVFDTATSAIPSNRTCALEVDDQSNIWVSLIGSESARLAKFDGVDWTVWDSNDGLSYPDHACIWTLEFFNGGLWVGGCDGLLRMDLASLMWTHETNELPANEPQALLNDGQGNLWIGYYPNPFGVGWNSITRYDGTDWQTYWPWSSNWVRGEGFNVDQFGTVWCGSSSGLWYFDGAQWVEFGTPLPSNGQSCFGQSVAVSPNGSLWWGLTYDGIWTNDPSGAVPVTENTLPTAAGGHVVPNPVRSEALIMNTHTLRSPATLRIMDAIGRTVRTEVVGTARPVTIIRGALGIGFYTFELLDDVGGRAAGRFMVE